MPTLQLTADEYLPCRINSMHLENRLRDIKTNRCDRLHRYLLRIVGASSGAHLDGTLVPVEEPSTHRSKLSDYSIASSARSRGTARLTERIAARRAF
jgi:hypothetical protein